MKESTNILISRTDAIGDVVLTLPMAGLLKRMYPKCTIYFLGQAYTEEVIKTSKHIDHFLDWSEIKKLHFNQQVNFFKALNISVAIHVFPNIYISLLFKIAKIPLRIGTSHRWYHWLFCNKKVAFSRLHSNMHEVQLNFHLLIPFGLKQVLPLNEIANFYGICPPQISDDINQLLDNNRFNLILHPKSRGNGKEWGLANYSSLISSLDTSKYKIFITGTQNELNTIQHDLLGHHPQVIDLIGKLKMHELISFIAKADGIVASGTGPLHLAASLGIHAIGLYPPIRPIFSRRWSPVGKNAKAFEAKKTCIHCNNKLKCDCLKNLSASLVLNYLNQLQKPTSQQLAENANVENSIEAYGVEVIAIEELIKDKSKRTYNPINNQLNASPSLISNTTNTKLSRTVFFLGENKNENEQNWVFANAEMLNKKGLDSSIIINKEAIKNLNNIPSDCFYISLSKFSYLNIFKLLKVARYFHTMGVSTIVVSDISELRFASICSKLSRTTNVVYHLNNVTPPLSSNILNKYFFNNIVTKVLVNISAHKYIAILKNYTLISKKQVAVFNQNNDLIEIENILGITG